MIMKFPRVRERTLPKNSCPTAARCRPRWASHDFVNIYVLPLFEAPWQPYSETLIENHMASGDRPTVRCMKVGIDIGRQDIASFTSVKRCMLVRCTAPLSQMHIRTCLIVTLWKWRHDSAEAILMISSLMTAWPTVACSKRHCQEQANTSKIEEWRMKRTDYDMSAVDEGSTKPTTVHRYFETDIVKRNT